MILIHFGEKNSTCFREDPREWTVVRAAGARARRELSALTGYTHRWMGCGFLWDCGRLWNWIQWWVHVVWLHYSPPKTASWAEIPSHCKGALFFLTYTSLVRAVSASIVIYFFFLLSCKCSKQWIWVLLLTKATGWGKYVEKSEGHGSHRVPRNSTEKENTHISLWISEC